jgi:hypothetical protein
MPYPEIKQERYSMIGGINTKVSRYQTGQQELIRLVNYDFSIPGSITKRPDTAQFLGTSFGPNIQSVYEMLHYNGASYKIIFGQTNAYWSGSTTAKLFYGYSDSVAGFTGYIIGGVTNGRISSMSYANNYWAAGINYNNAGTVLTSFGRFSFSMGFFGNATPEVPNGNFDNTSGNFFGVTFASCGPPSYFLSGSAYRYSYAFYTDRGIVGPATPIFYRPYLANQGATTVTLTIPGFTVQAFKAFLNLSQTLLIFRETAIGVTEALTNVANPVYTTLAVWSVPVGLGHTKIIDWGATTGMSYLLGSTALVTDLGQNLVPNNNWPMLRGRFGNKLIDNDNGYKMSSAPRFISTINGMGVYSGFSAFPSNICWSELDLLDVVKNENTQEVITDDGDVITGTVSYNNSVVIGKRRSLHEFTGTSPDNTATQVQTTAYGFMNNQSTCIFNNQLWFIDGYGKGVGQYNGANTEIISTKVEDVFKRLNLLAAQDLAWMLHVKQRNEVWIGLPVDNSPVVNVIVVFDYIANAWTTYEGLSPNCVTIAKGTLTLPAAVMGFSNGDIRCMNATYTGAEFMTTVVRFPFVNNFGWSTTQVFRWLFLDVDPVVGATHTFNANFYLNAGNDVALTRGITTTSYQARTDFGLPGKGLSIELIEGSTLPCRINGYTVASRFQRQV